MIQGHGGNIVALAQKLGCQPEEITDMSSNINPLGTAPGLLAHLEHQLPRIRALPEADGHSAVMAMAKLLGISPARILPGNGTTQFIYTACTALASRRVLVLGPTYSDYADACRMHELEPDFFYTRPEDAFMPDLAELSARLGDYDTVFLCNPNNPTGTLIPQQHIVELCCQHPRLRFILDESYLSFAAGEPAMDLCQIAPDNLLILWSVSKIFGIPGLRAGFLVAHPQHIAAFSRFMQPWSLNTLAQEAVCFLGDHQAEMADFITASQQYISREGQLFCQILQQNGLEVFPSQTSFFLIQLPKGIQAPEVCAYMGKQRFLIRNCDNFCGLDARYIRIALKDSASNAAVARHLCKAIQIHTSL